MYERFLGRMLLVCVCMLLAVGFLPSCSDDDETPSEPGNGVEYGWSVVTKPTIESLYGFWGTSSTNIYGCGEGETVIHWDGSSWSTLRSGDYILRKVWGTSDTDIFFVGNYPPPNRVGYVLHYDGTNWEVMNPVGFSMTNQIIFNVWGTGPDNVYFVGGTYGSNDGFILNYDGTILTDVHTEPGSWLYGIWGTASDNIYAVGVGGKILRYDGGSWDNVPHGATGQNLEAVMGTDANDIWAVGWYGTLLHYDGSSWTKDTFPTDPQGPTVGQTQFNVHVFAPDRVFSVGKDRSILYFNGSGWSVMMYEINTEELFGLWGATSTDVWAAGTEGYLLHYGEI
jgi:hypothetical protein